ncbi:MAG: carboxymuconolactone decarboxylase family protein [Tepidiformaceae bacterium]
MTEQRSSRPNVSAEFKEGYRAVAALEAVVANSGLDQTLIELVKTRASQINGCAYCIDMHTKDARARGETEQRLYALNGWRETPFFSERERSALALTEAITLVAQGHVPDDVVEEALEWFEPEEYAKVVFLICTINSWNRIAITSRSPVGAYVSRFSEHP